jgi:V/A-type H+-transporting ATPase subunit I
MITKMDKYSFILFHTELDPFLEKIQELGLVDITRESKAFDNISKELYSLVNRYSKAVKELTSVYNSLSDEVIASLKGTDHQVDTNPEILLENAESLLSRREQYIQELEQFRKELAESRQWGILDQNDLAKIKELGYNIRLYTVPEKSFNPEWEESYPLQVLNQANGRVYFAILSDNNAEFRFELPESKMPQRSYDIIEKKISETLKNITDTEREIAIAYSSVQILDKAMYKKREELDVYLAGASSLKEAEGTIALLTGFAPVDSRTDVTTALEKEGVYFLLEEAQVEDNPPVKLKNGFFAKLYEPIGELYMLPKYGELDLTPYFAPFYMLFFGLCLGDMGYGLTILIGAGLAKLKFPSFKSYLTLAQFLGVGAILMAALSGVFFGAKLQEILPLPDSITELFFSDLKMFWFAIIFGLVQIVFARMLNAIYLIINKGWQYGIHNIGWSIAIIWAAWMYATTMDPTITMPGWMDYIAICGAAMILFFSSDSGNIFTRLFKGVTAFYDVTSIFGDMLSYIRLFGLGTAGAILGMVVNSVAMSLAGIPYMGWFFALLMLIVGHIMVLLLSSLGAFVHPMRLTFVEFYKNAGFGGGGRAFRPMGKEIK